MRFATLMLTCLLSTSALAQTIPTVPEQPGQHEASRIKAGTYDVDPFHTQVVWTVNHLGISLLQGMFGASAGSLTIDPADPSKATLDVTFDVDRMSVTSAEFARDLKAPAFFDAAEFPTARFVADHVTVRPDNTATVTGNLTIKDQTKPVTVEASFKGAGLNPVSKAFEIGFEGRAMLKRSDFGLGMAAPAVSDTVIVDINAAFAAP